MTLYRENQGDVVPSVQPIMGSGVDLLHGSSSYSAGPASVHSGRAWTAAQHTYSEMQGYSIRLLAFLTLHGEHDTCVQTQNDSQEPGCQAARRAHLHLVRGGCCVCTTETTVQPALGGSPSHRGLAASCSPFAAAWCPPVALWEWQALHQT